MCGIWGFSSIDRNLSKKNIYQIMKELFLLSESRGKEAAGIAIASDNTISVFKRGQTASRMIRDNEYLKFLKLCFQDCKNGKFTAIGHSRLVTNGSEDFGDNNQPVAKNQTVTVHNGIIVNCNDLWKKYNQFEKNSQVDTEIFVDLYSYYKKKDKDLIKAIQNVYKEICGMASTLTLMGDNDYLLAASNNGSLYYCRSVDEQTIIFASERLTIEKIINNHKYLKSNFSKSQIAQINCGNNLLVKLDNINCYKFGLDTLGPSAPVGKGFIRKLRTNKEKQARKKEDINILKESLYSKYEINLDQIKKLRRCSRCILPETMPFIEFDEKGVCNYCKAYKKMQYKSKEKLYQWADNQKKGYGKNDSIVSFSGGRDSSYGLHYFVKELGLNPIAYSYDWGMVTDLARRNQSRMCSKLGVELIIVSADIRKKRDNIRKNVLAWMKSPDLGIVPLFMAGDKQYFYYANKIRKDYGLKGILLASNPFEKTYFKSGFAGVKPTILNQNLDDLDFEKLHMGDVFDMSFYYLKQYIGNTAYINTSLLDTITAMISYYIIPHNYFRLFDYIEWNEDEVNKVLLNQYDWEIASDSKSTWRIGDGTAPFYNYIYYTVCGFTENDTLRSNQIREGMISREQALEYVYRDNAPRFDSMKWYFDAIHVDMEQALKVVNKIQKKYVNGE